MPRYFSMTERLLVSVFGFLLAFSVQTGWAAEEANLVKDIQPGSVSFGPPEQRQRHATTIARGVIAQIMDRVHSVKKLTN